LKFKLHFIEIPVIDKIVTRLRREPTPQCEARGHQPLARNPA